MVIANSLEELKRKRRIDQAKRDRSMIGADFKCVQNTSYFKETVDGMKRYTKDSRNKKLTDY